MTPKSGSDAKEVRDQGSGMESATESTAALIKLERNKKFLKDQADVEIELSAPDDPVLLAAIVADQKPDRELALGRVTASASAGIPAIEFGGDAPGTVSFNCSAGSQGGFGIYFDRDRLLQAIQFDTQQDLGAPLACLANDPSGYYAALHWKYDVEGQGACSLALGAAGSVRFGGEANRDGLFAVFRRFPAETGIRTAAARTFNGWMLPRQIASADDLQPETWIVAEVHSGVAFKLAGTLGYNFSWLRRLKAGALGGDIGLKIQLGLETTVGLSASGRYALVVARETDAPVLRLRLYKLRLKGWDFALNGGAAVETVAELPQGVDDLIKAAFGVLGTQIVRELQAIEKWTDPDKKPSQVLAGLSEEYGRKLLERLTGIPVVGRSLAAFNQARQQVVTALEKWNDLDLQAHSASTAIMKMLESEGVDLDPVQNLAKSIADSDFDSFKRLLALQLDRSDFFHSSEGKWLESALAAGILSALNEPCFNELRKTAMITSEILDGGLLAGVLKKLQAHVNDALNLERIQSVIESADIDRLEPWLRVKLEEFLGTSLDIPALVEVQAAINQFLRQRQEIYSRARAALNKKYEIALHSAYTQASVDTALVDLEFNFSEPGAGVALADALRGNFCGLLLRPQGCVKVHMGVLSHGIKRESHVEVSMPYFDARTDHIQESVAKFTAEETEGKVYVLDARDKVADKGKRVSTLSVGAYLPLGDDDSVRRHSPQSLSYSYCYREAVRGMKTAHLRHQLASYAGTYFKSAFAGGKGSYDSWIDDLDRTIGAKGIGNVVLSLELSVPGEITRAWFSAPGSRKAPQYMDMSKRLQRAVKLLVPFYYLQDLDNYRDLSPVYALLLYSAVPPMNAVRSENGRIIETGKDNYWDWVDPSLRRAVVFSELTQSNLRANLTQIRSMLQSAGRRCEDYSPDDSVVGNILRCASEKPGTQLLSGLLKFEADVVRGSVDAALALTAFLESRDADAAKAIDALAEFGAAASETFNRELGGVYGGGPSRPLSTMLFIEAAAALDGRAHPESYALLDLTVLNDAAPFPGEYLDGTAPKKEDIRIAQRLLSPI